LSKITKISKDDNIEEVFQNEEDIDTKAETVHSAQEYN